MKKKLLFFVLPVITLMLELIPYGAVCIFAVSPEERMRETFSYFDLIPFGYANFPPFLTALLTCTILALLLVYLFTDSTPVITVTKALLCAATAVSLCPLLYGIRYYSPVGALISISLIAEAVFVLLTAKKPSKA